MHILCTWIHTNASSLVCTYTDFANIVLILTSSGRLGPMVTFTLKLGISILNGGNVLVQQVLPLKTLCGWIPQIMWTVQDIMWFWTEKRLLDIMPLADVNIWNIIAHIFLCSRKCWITWRKREMLVFSRVCQDSCSLAGIQYCNADYTY